MVEGGARTGVPVVQRPSPPRKVSVHAVGAVDGVKHDHKDGEDGVVGGGLETDAVGANVKVAVVSEEAEGRGGEGAAGAGDSARQRRLEHVEGEGGGKVGGALEAKEAKLSLGHAAPEGGRPLLGGAVKEASTPGGGSRAKETQEGCSVQTTPLPRLLVERVCGKCRRRRQGQRGGGHPRAARDQAAGGRAARGAQWQA